jgi:hypothetical protein
MWEGIIGHKWLLLGVDYTQKIPKMKYRCMYTGDTRYEDMHILD